MKQFIRKFFAAAMLLSMTFAFSSCEGSLDDVFGQWDNPANVPPQVFAFKNALDNGSTLVVKFDLNGEKSVSFKKEGDVYKCTSDLNPENYDLKLDATSGMLVLTIKDDEGNVVGQIFFNTSDGSYYVVNNIGGNVIFDGNVIVNTYSGTVNNLCPDKAVIKIDADGDDTFEKELPVYYNKAKGETWKNVVDRYDLSTILKGILYFYSDETYVHEGTKNIQVVGTDGDHPAGKDDKVGIEDEADFAGPYKAIYTAPLT
jgi:hypothetical protein